MTLPGRIYCSLLYFGFHLLYNEMAWTYDTVSWLVSLGQWRDWGRSGISHLAGPRVLELAFGTGDILLDLHAAGFQAFGLDLSPFMVSIARRKLNRAHGCVPLTRGAAAALPFADTSFDSIILTFPTPFVFEERVLEEIARVLRPGGRLVIVGRGMVQRPALVARFIEWLYVVTGQRPSEASSLTGRLRVAGWNAEEVESRLPRSTVGMVVAWLGSARTDGQSDASCGALP